MAMSKSTKAALMSAFTFPGAGLFIVNKKLIGAALVAFSIMDLFVIFNIISETIQHRFDQMRLSLNSLSGNAQTDIFAPLSSSDAQTILIATVLFNVIYIYSIYLSWHYGRLIDSKEQLLAMKSADSKPD